MKKQALPLERKIVLAVKPINISINVYSQKILFSRHSWYTSPA